jgi:hypothetical protein
MLELILRGESKYLKAHQVNDSRASHEITNIWIFYEMNSVISNFKIRCIHDNVLCLF